jgi:hypothetical protein
MINTPNGITNTGRKAEEEFCTITEAKIHRKGDPHGDATVFKPCGHSFPVEVKRDSLNQVRPNHYLPLVVWCSKTHNWFVIPPDDVLRRLKKQNGSMKAGQHSTNSLEVHGMGSISGKQYEKYRVSTTSALLTSVISAYDQGEAAAFMKAAAATSRRNTTLHVKDDHAQLKHAMEAEKQTLKRLRKDYENR